jgi:hypothetical protein
VNKILDQIIVSICLDVYINFLKQANYLKQFLNKVTTNPIHQSQISDYSQGKLILSFFNLLETFQF